MKEDHFANGSLPEPNLLSSLRVVIVGLGLMGGSMALALRDHCASLWGIDPDRKTREMAARSRVVDRAAADPSQLLPEADLIILAAPVGAILATLEALPRLHPDPAIVLDIGSTKAEIVDTMRSLPHQFDPIGGHPICGKEKNSLENASPELFRGAPFVLSALERTTDRGRACALEIVSVLGGKPLWQDPEQHDKLIAATSHLPYLAACALSLATPQAALDLVGPGFRSTSRLAASSPVMMLDIIRTNRKNLLPALQRFREQLDLLENDLQQEKWDDLADMLTASADARAALVDYSLQEEAR